MERQQSVFFADTKPTEKPIYKSAEELAIETWGFRQTRLAESVAKSLHTLYEHDGWTWTVSRDFFGRPVDTEILVGTSPNEDGTTSGIILAGDFEMFASFYANVQQENEKRLQYLQWLYGGFTDEDNMNKEQFEEFMKSQYQFAEKQDRFIETMQVFTQNHNRTADEINFIIKEQNQKSDQLNGVLEQQQKRYETIIDALESREIPITRLSIPSGLVIKIISTIIACAIIVAGAVIGASIYIHTTISDVKTEIASVKGEVGSLAVLINERVPDKNASTSTNTHSSTPPRATNAPPKP